MPAGGQPYTNEQIAAIMEMGDISGAEANLQRQQAMTGALRQRAMHGGGSGVAGGLTNALSGIGAGLGYRQGMGMQQGIGNQRADALGRIKTAFGIGGGAGGPPGSMAENEDLMRSFGAPVP